MIFTKKFKKAIAFLLAGVMTLGCIPNVYFSPKTVQAAEEVTPKATSELPIVAAGNHHIVILIDGKLYGVGSSQYGQLTGTATRNTPTLMNTSSVDGEIIDVKANTYTTVILTDTGSLYFTGAIGGVENRSFGKLNTQTGKTIKDFGIGYDQVYVKYTDGTVDVAGSYLYGELASGEANKTDAVLRQVKLPDTNKGYRVISSASAYIDGDKVYGAGKYNYIGLGSAEYSFKTTFTELPSLPLGEIPNSLGSQINGFFAYTENKEIYGIGKNSTGALGNGGSNAYTGWTQVIKPTGVTKWTDFITGGCYNQFAYGDDGKVYGWGYNTSGSLGVGDATDKIHQPSLVYYEDENIKGKRGKEFDIPHQMDTSFSVSVAVMDDGTLYTWGRGEYSGHNDTSDLMYPRQLHFVDFNLSADKTDPIYIENYGDETITITGETFGLEGSEVSEIGSWIRVPTTDYTNYSTGDNFKDYLDSNEEAGNAGEITLSGNVGHEKKFTFDADRNGRYWFKILLETGEYCYKYIIIDNFYIKPPIYVKGVDSSNSTVLYNGLAKDNLDYIESFPEVYGISYDLNGTSILKTTSNGLDAIKPTPYRSITIKPKSLAPGYNTVSSKSYILNTTVGSSTGSTPENPIVFTYTRNTSNWTDVTYKGVDKYGAPIKDITGKDVSALGKEKLPIGEEITRTPPDVVGYKAVGYLVDSTTGTPTPLNDVGDAVFTVSSKMTLYVVYEAETEGVSGTVIVKDTQGSIEAPNGIPLSNVDVVFTKKDNNTVKYTDTTGVNGTYHLNNVDFGTYTVTTLPSPITGFKTYIGEVTVSELMQYNLELVPNDNTGVSYITVTDDYGIAQQNATVYVNGETYKTSANGTTLAVNLPVSGTYNILVSKDGFTPKTENITLETGDVYKNATVKLSVGSEGSLWGYINDDNGNKLAGATVTVLGGQSATTDSNGFYVIENVAIGSHAILVEKDGYDSKSGVVAVKSYEFTQKDFDMTNENSFVISGIVTDERTTLPIAGAKIEYNGISTTTDDFGYYVLGPFESGTTIEPQATFTNYAGSTQTINNITLDKIVDFNLSQVVNITVIGKVAGEDGIELYRFVVPKYYNDTTPVDITSYHVPIYKVLNPTTADGSRVESIIPNKEQTIIFEYESNLTNVTINAYDVDTNEPISEFTPFSIITELGSPFKFTEQLNIVGYDYVSTSNDGVIENVTNDNNSIILYYKKQVNPTEGEFNIIAVDADTNEVIGLVKNNSLVNKGDTFTATDANAPTESDILGLKYYTLKKGSGEPTSITYNGYDSPNDVTYKYDRIKRGYTVERWDAVTGTKIDTEKTYDNNIVGQVYTVSRPSAPDGYQPILGSDNQIQFFLEPSDDMYIVKFFYTPTEQSTIDVKAVYDNDGVETEIVGYNQTLVGTKGSDVTITAPLIPGYTLSAGSSNTVTKVFGTDTEIKFVYKKDMVNVTVEYRLDTINGTMISDTEIKQVQKDVSTLILGKYIQGHVIQEPFAYSQIFTEDTTLVFVYKSVTSVVDDNTIDISIKGKSGTDELYNYTVTVEKDKEDLVIEAFDVNKYQLIDSSTKVATIPTDGSVTEHVFDYESLETTIQISTLLGDGTQIPDTSSVIRPVIKGEPYVAYAPYIPGYNLVGKTSQTVESVSGTEADNIEFVYEVATGNVVINLIDAKTGRVIKTVSENVTLADGNKTIEIPDLTDENWTLVSGQTPEIITYSNETQTIQYEYEKAKRSVDVYTSINDVETLVSTEEFDLDTIQKINAPNVDDAKLTDSNPKTIMIEKGDGNQKVVFMYQTLKEGDIVVNAICEGDILQTYTLKTTVNGTLKVNAPTILGYKLKTGESSTKTGTAPETVEFEYEKDEVALTISYKSGTDTVKEDVTYQVKKGDTFTVYAPHIDGFVLSGESSKTFTNLKENENYTFNYEQLNVAIETVDVVIKGMADDVELYSYTVAKPKDSGTFEVDAFDVNKYEIVSPKTAEISTDGNTTQHIFNYKTLETTVTIVAQLKDDPSQSISVERPCVIGEPYVIQAPYIPGYNLVGRTRLSINSVTGEEELVFEYELATGNVVVNLVDNKTGKVIKTTSENVTLADGSKVIEIPDLTDDNWIIVSGQTAQTVNYLADTQTIEYKYEKAKQNVDVYTSIGGIESLIPVSTIEYDVDTVQYINAPNVDDAKLVDANPKTVLIEKVDGNQKVVFNYETLLEDEIVVNALYDGVILQSYTLNTTIGKSLKVNAPTILGYKLKNGEVTQKTGTAPEIVKFQYEKDEVTLTVSYKSGTETIKDDVIYQVKKGDDFTVYAPHIDGYVLTGEDTKTFTGVEESQNYTFNYKPFSEVIEENTVNVVIKGMADGEELYSYTVTKPKGSGTFEIEAFDVNKYKLIDSSTQKATIPTDGSITEHIFNYNSLETTVTINTVLDSDGSVIEGTLPIVHQAVKGQSYVAYAPYISGYNLVGLSSQKIDSVTGTEEITFRYEHATGNVVVNLIDEQTGRVIKTVSENVTLADGSKVIEIPDLTNENWIIVSGQTEKTVNYLAGTQTIEYKYEKAKRNVDVYTSINGIESLIPVYTIEYDVDSVQNINAPNVDDAKLADTNPKTVLIQTGDGNQKVVFNYETLLQGEIVVNAVSDGVILQAYSLETTVGNTIKANAPTILGYKLKDGEVTQKIGTAPEIIVFEYEKDEVTLTVSYKSGDTEIKDDVKYEVRKGDDFTVYAPHISGYVLTGEDSKTFTKLEQDTNFTFNYTKINNNPTDNVNLNVKFIDIQTGEEIGQDSIENIAIGDTYSYQYPSLESAGYVFNSSSPLNNGGTIDITLKESDNEILVYYEKKTADITVNHYDKNSGNLLNTENITNQKVGTLYTAKYYDTNNYYYHSGNVQKVVVDGENVIDIYYISKSSIPSGSVVVEHVDQDTSIILKTEIISDLKASKNVETSIELDDELESQEDFETTKILTEPYLYNTSQEQEAINIKNSGYSLVSGDTIYTIPVNTSIKINYTSYVPKNQSVTIEYYDVTNGKVIETVQKTGVLNTVYVPYIKYFDNYKFNSIEPVGGILVTNGENKVRVNYSEIKVPEKVSATVTVRYTANGNLLKTETLSGYYVGDSLTYSAGSKLTINGRNYKLISGESSTKSIVLDAVTNTLEYKYVLISSGGGGGGSGGGGGGSSSGGETSTSDKTTTDDKAEPTTEDEVKPTPVDELTDTDVDLLGLETVNHIKYINGYADGTFKPKNGLTRAEAASILYNLSTKVDKTKIYSNPYSDVSKDAWYYNQIGALSEIGVLLGYPDGTFKPNEQISRAEFVTLLAKAKSNIKTYEPIYKDIDTDHWACDYVTTASKNNWINGYENNEFRPDNIITRGEAVTIINNVLNRKITKEEASKVSNLFADINETYWAYPNIIEASITHDYNSLDDGHEEWKTK